MGVDAMRIRVQVRKFGVISIKTCYRLVCNHPFLVGMVCFLVFLYRSFPFLFSLFVSASPVLVCTAVLLGTLLSFGELNLPEVETQKEEEEEEEEKEEEEEGEGEVVSHEISSLKAGVVNEATFIAERGESFGLERFVGGKRDRAEKGTGEEGSVENEVTMIEMDDGLGDYMPLADKSSRDIQREKQVMEEVQREELDKKTEIDDEKQGVEEMSSHGEVVEHGYTSLENMRDEDLDVAGDKSPSEFNDTEKGDHLEFSADSTWKRVNNDDEEEDDEDEDASDSGSDRAESSSPDASMADIIPMLDELHPLLDEDTPLPGHTSHDASDAGSERSQRSKEISADSGEDTDNQADEEEDDDHENEEEEEAPGPKEDASKSAIKWTEDDQKNLMDLGTLELERNQRLESLIARRRARRNMKLMAEKNLIDLDGADLPLNVPPISTTRRNPFDLPYDSYDDVPGSAPSILLPRRNPFDLPYDSNEEKPDLKGDSFQQEFSAVQPREPVFRRHESFSVGPSVLGGPRHERQELRWKPYFVPERFAAEGTSYPTFQRQLSEVSESKVSSVPDTESLSSAVEDDDKKLNEEDSYQETEEVSNPDHASLLVEQGSLSSEDADSADAEQVENSDVHQGEEEITLGGVENHRETDSSLSASGGATPVEVNTSEILLRMGAGEEEYSSRSSLSSLSEIDEKISDLKRDASSTEPRIAQIEESFISTQSSLNADFHFMSEVGDENECREPVVNPSGEFAEESDINGETSLESDSHSVREKVNDNHRDEPALEPRENQAQNSRLSIQTSLDPDFHSMSGLVDDNQHKEPVYDSSPSSIGKYLSFSSVSSDAPGEVSGRDSPPGVAEFADKELEVNGGSTLKSVNESESTGKEDVEITECDLTKDGPSGVNPSFDGQNVLMIPESEIAQGPANSLPASSDSRLIKEVLVHKEDNSLDERGPLQPSGLDAEIIMGDATENLNSASSSYDIASEEKALPATEEHHPPLVVQHVSANHGFFSLEAEPAEEHRRDIQLEQEQSHSPRYASEIHVNDSKAVFRKLDSAVSSSDDLSSNDLQLSEPEERQPTVVPEHVPDSHLHIASSETKHLEEYSLKKEESLQFNQDKKYTMTGDQIPGVGLLQDVNQKLVSSGSHSREKGADKQLSWSDKSVVELSFNVPEEPREPSTRLAESTLKVCVTSNANVQEAYCSENKISNNIILSTSDSTTALPESPEYETPAAHLNFQDDTLDKIVYEDSGHVSEQSNFLTEVFGSPVSEDNNTNDEEDEIKEIDEVLLSELDRIGDFSVKKVVGESFQDEQRGERISITGPEIASLQEDSGRTEFKAELPVLEVRSAEDIDMAFKQLHEGADVEEVILPSMIKDQLVVDQSIGPGVTNSGLQVLEARTLEDIQTTVKQVQGESSRRLSEHSHSKDSPPGVIEMDSSREHPVVEVRAVEDINLALKQHDNGVYADKVILPSTAEQQLVVDESRYPGQTSSEMSIVEARSLEDSHTVVDQVSEQNIEPLAQPSDSYVDQVDGSGVGSKKEIESRTSEVREEKTVKDIKPVSGGVIEVGSIKNSAFGESGVQLTSTSFPPVVHETHGNSSLSMEDGEEKKALSHRSNSSGSDEN